MSTIFAVYLALCLAVILLGISIWSRLAWVAAITGSLWLVVGLFCVLNAAGDFYIDALGIVCLFAGIGSFAVPWLRREKKVVQVEPKHDRVRDIQKAWRKLDARYKGEEVEE